MSASVSVQWSDLANEGARRDWDALPGAGVWDTAFGTTTFLEALAAQVATDIMQVTTTDDKGVCAAARLGVRSKFGIAYSPVPPLTAFSALRLRDPLREADVHERRSALEPLLAAVEQRFVAAAIHLPPAVQDTRVLIWRGWSVKPLYTYRIRIDSQRDPLDAWSESARRLARQEESEYDLVETDAATQARLVTGSYARKDRSTPLNVDGLTRLIGGLVQSGSVRTVGVVRRGTDQVEASVALLRDASQSYYWLAGGRPGPAMTVLLAHVLRELASSGTTVFDFVGANTASIAEFKRKFGGQLTSYFRATWQRGLVGRLVGPHV